MFGGNVRPSHTGRTRDSEHGGASSGTSLKAATKGGAGNDDTQIGEGIEGQGDGYHHAEIHENESGAHSMHTSPTGEVTHKDHADLKEATSHIDRMMGHEDMGKDPGADESHEKFEQDDDQPDFSGTYSK